MRRFLLVIGLMLFVMGIAMTQKTVTGTVTDEEGEITEMRNANFFEFADDHRISKILIIATQPLD